ncbi:MAG: SIMPL domain-containing protein [Cyanothece sp. SIO2G6]|nr:SIMPL domain-containing protein [Cyanothece sp. SIO2G6]
MNQITPKKLKMRWAWLAILPVAIATSQCTLSPPQLSPLAHAQAQEANLRILSVTGQGTETLPTTIAMISLAVEVQGATAKAVQQDMAQRSSDLVSFLETQAIDQLETTGIRLNPRYDYRNNRQLLVGYTATNRVRFEIAVDDAGEILDNAVAAGATRIDNIQFRATDEAIATAQRQALRAATLDAQSQADAVLDTLGLSRQAIVGIQVNNASTPLPPPTTLQSLRAVAESDVATTPVRGGDQDIRANVTLQIRY